MAHCIGATDEAHGNASKLETGAESLDPIPVLLGPHLITTKLREMVNYMALLRSHTQTASSSSFSLFKISLYFYQTVIPSGNRANQKKLVLREANHS